MPIEKTRYVRGLSDLLDGSTASTDQRADGLAIDEQSDGHDHGVKHLIYYTRVEYFMNCHLAWGPKREKT